MKKIALTVATALAATLFVSSAEAHKSYWPHYHYKKAPKAKHTGKIEKKHAARVRFGGKKGLGYWRPGPKTGYGFAFSSYRKDPFGSDDYWDGGRCYYLHHKNFCMPNKIFNGFE